MATLFQAATTNNLEIVENYLAQNGGVINLPVANVRRLLKLAVVYHSVDVARCLLEHGGEVDAIHPDGFTALHHAVLQNDLPMVNLLLEFNANTETLAMESGTALHIAARDVKRLQIVIRLLEYGANIDALNDIEQTPLFVAQSNWRVNNLEVVKYLVEHGANVNHIARSKEAVLHLAARQNQPMTMSYLSQRPDININIQDSTGKTPLSIACVNSFGTQIVRILLNHRADRNLADQKGNTPLIYAAQWGLTEIVGLLLNNGANPAQMNNNGDTALDFAVKNKHTHTAQSIMKYMYVNRTWIFDRERFAALPQELRIQIGVIVKLWEVAQQEETGVLSGVPLEVLYMLLKQMLFENSVNY